MSMSPVSMLRASAALRTALAVLGCAGALLLAGCERPPVQTTQQGYRGTAMQQTDNPRLLAALKAELPVPPPDTPAPPADLPGPKARDIYQNVKVLGDLPVADFVRHMSAITAWVSPAEGCNYCHNPANLAEDSKYTKVVARRMIEMTRQINSQWKAHVADTGVTCYTCHRGQAVPPQVWFKAVPPKANSQPMLGNDFGQNKAVPSVALTSLPYDPFSAYLTDKQEIRVYTKEPLPQKGTERAPIQTAEQTYALMMHFSKGLGVNCTFCHNTQAFSHWVPKKTTAWHGIRMAREINNDYLVPLTATFPAQRLGAGGDVAKVYCGSCHLGQNKPLEGQAMAKLYAGLSVPPQPAADAASAPGATPVPAKATRPVAAVRKP